MPCPMWLGIIQATEVLNRTRKWRKGDSLSLLASLNGARGLLLPRDWGLYHQCSWFLGLQTWARTHTGSPGAQAFAQTITHHQLSWASILHMADCGTSRPPYSRESTPCNQSLYVYTYNYTIVSFWRALTDTGP